MTKEIKKIRVSGQTIEISNPSKILFPKSKITKWQVVQYYKKIAKKMLPHIKDRPISMMRYPNGIKKEGFFQKNVSDFFPKWVKTVSIRRKEQENIRMVICNDVKTLVYLANLACITPHVWLSRKDRPNLPDRIIFDLDPGKKAFSSVIEAAYILKKILDKKKMRSQIMTTGSKGLHIIVPIKRGDDFVKTRKLAKEIAKEAVGLNPNLLTIEPRKEKRKGKIFIDYLRNGYAQTAVAPYALRAIEKAPIAMPLSWGDLKRKGLGPQSYTLDDLLTK